MPKKNDKSNDSLIVSKQKKKLDKTDQEKKYDLIKIVIPNYHSNNLYKSIIIGNNNEINFQKTKII